MLQHTSQNKYTLHNHQIQYEYTHNQQHSMLRKLHKIIKENNGILPSQKKCPKAGTQLGWSGTKAKQPTDVKNNLPSMLLGVKTRSMYWFGELIDAYTQRMAISRIKMVNTLLSVSSWMLLMAHWVLVESSMHGKSLFRRSHMWTDPSMPEARTLWNKPL